MESVKIFGIDNEKLYDECLAIEEEKLAELDGEKTGAELSGILNDPTINRMVTSDFKPSEFQCHSRVANLFPHYNIATYDIENIQTLKEEIIRVFKEKFNPEQGTYYIHLWVNILRYGETIGWHYHRIIGDKSWHGVYYVHATGSETLYGDNFQVEKAINSENGYLAITETTQYMDAVEAWQHKDKHRVTIGYDIFQTYLPHAVKFTV